MRDSDECLRLLHIIDEHPEIDVTPWEAEFLDSIFRQTYPLTDRQISVANRIINTYSDYL
jgi:hypothetical protein